MAATDAAALRPRESPAGTAKSREDSPLSGAAVRERIPLMMPLLPTADDLLPYLRRIDANRWYANFGPLVGEFEARIAESFVAAGACRVVSVSSCTTGIELALRALALPPGAPVLVPALTFIATASAVRCAGLAPVVADIDPHSWLLTPEIARAAVRTIGARAVVPVTTFGVDQDGEAWSAFARDTHVPVIIDAAAGFGNQRDPGPTCAVFSLHATKPLAAGEGGFVVTRDAHLAHAIRRLSNFGINLDRPHDGPIGSAVATGTNAKLSEYHAAVALASLDRWAATAAERSALFARVARTIQAACHGQLAQQAAPADTVRSVCAFGFPDPAARDRAELACRQRGIGTRRWYLPTIDRQPAFGHVAHLPTPCSHHLGDRLLGVPFYPGLVQAAIDEIALALGSAFEPS
jgi:dTDP-4-amino-4,6-dideoxygalactose transaminase